MRWGIAWSHSIDLSPANKLTMAVSQNAKKEKPRPPQQYVVPDNCGESLDEVAQRILHILNTISVRNLPYELSLQKDGIFNVCSQKFSTCIDALKK